MGDHKIHPENSCLVMSCKLNGFGQPIIETSNFECSPLNCALNKQYIPTGTCCPMCTREFNCASFLNCSIELSLSLSYTVPSCTEAINGRVLDIKNNSGCEKCECNVSIVIQRSSSSSNLLAYRLSIELIVTGNPINQCLLCILLLLCVNVVQDFLVHI